MKKSFLRLLGTTLLLILIIGILISIVGWFVGWKTATQFSNAFFLPGGICIVIGILSVVGGYSMRSDFKVLYSQSAGDMSTSERAKRWVADMSAGYGTFIFMFLTGGFLILLAIIIGSVF